MSERNTGYQFVSTDTEAVESLLISIYEKITGVSVKPASPEKLFIQFVAAVVIQERGLNNYTGNQNIPSRAEGENLDALAELFYVTQRPAAQAAVCTERFHISEAQTTAILIPAGTRVTDASGTLTWETVADAYVSIGETYADVQIRCQTVGAVGNGYAVGQINTFVDLFDYCDRCENLTASDDGADQATDDEFYELMPSRSAPRSPMWWRTAPATERWTSMSSWTTAPSPPQRSKMPSSPPATMTRCGR